MDLSKIDLPDFGSDGSTVNGEFIRKFKEYTRWIGKDLPTEKNKRYHLFASHTCPWSHKTVIVRKLKQLENVIGLTIITKYDETHGRGWKYEEGPVCLKDKVHEGFVYLKDLYSEITDLVARPTTPTLYDTKTNQVVSNNDEAIQIMFNSSFSSPSSSGNIQTMDLFPENVKIEMDRLNSFLYENVNNGVYRCGFATSQEGYEKAVKRLFISLDWLDRRLSKRRFLFGNSFTDSDWRLFVTLIRFDRVYYFLFKCNIKRIRDYEYLFGWMKDMYQVPGVKETVKFDKIKSGYFSLKFINPYQIIPVGPEIEDLDSYHGRDKFELLK